MDLFLTDGGRQAPLRRIGRAAAFGLAAALHAPAWAGDFGGETIDPPATLVAAAHSTVAPVSPTEEQFNGDVAHVEVAVGGDRSIAAALSVNDVFGVAEGKAVHEPATAADLVPAETSARLRDDLSGVLSIDNDLDQPTVRQLLAAPGDLMPGDGGGSGPIALNMAGD